MVTGSKPTVREVLGASSTGFVWSDRPSISREMRVEIGALSGGAFRVTRAEAVSRSLPEVSSRSRLTLVTERFSVSAELEIDGRESRSRGKPHVVVFVFEAEALEVGQEHDLLPRGLGLVQNPLRELEAGTEARRARGQSDRGHRRLERLLVRRRLIQDLGAVGEDDDRSPVVGTEGQNVA